MEIRMDRIKLKQSVHLLSFSFKNMINRLKIQLVIIAKYSKRSGWIEQITFEVEVVKWDKQIINFSRISERKGKRTKKPSNKKVCRNYRLKLRRGIEFGWLKLSVRKISVNFGGRSWIAFNRIGRDRLLKIWLLKRKKWNIFWIFRNQRLIYSLRSRKPKKWRASCCIWWLNKKVCWMLPSSHDYIYINFGMNISFSQNFFRTIARQRNIMKIVKI